MRIRSDGSIQSSNTPTHANSGRNEDSSLYRCIVTKVIYVGDPSNITNNASNPRILYDVIVLGGFVSGQIISNCRLATSLGGESSFYERVLRACTEDISVSRLSDADGDIVFVQYIQGHTGYPVIIGLDQGIHTSSLIGAKVSEGPRSLKEYNGVREIINRDGEWKQEIKGGSSVPEKGKFTANQEVLVSSTISKDEKLIRAFKSGLQIVEDGKNDLVTITTKSGVSVTIDGAGNKVILAKGATIIELDGAGDKISLKGGFVDLGSSVSDFAVLFTELLTNFNTHTHIWPGGLVPAPTTPPTAPMLQTVGSLTVKVQP